MSQIVCQTLTLKNARVHYYHHKNRKNISLKHFSTTNPASYDFLKLNLERPYFNLNEKVYFFPYTNVSVTLPVTNPYPCVNIYSLLTNRACLYNQCGEVFCRCRQLLIHIHVSTFIPCSRTEPV